MAALPPSAADLLNVALPAAQRVVRDTLEPSFPPSPLMQQVAQPLPDGADPDTRHNPFENFPIGIR